MHRHRNTKKIYIFPYVYIIIHQHIALLFSQPQYKIQIKHNIKDSHIFFLNCKGISPICLCSQENVNSEKLFLKLQFLQRISQSRFYNMKPSHNAFQTSVALSDLKCPKIQRLLRSGVFLFHFNEESNESLNATCTVFHTCINLFHFFFCSLILQYVR